jgi:tryptophanyl-tRNA synthetase
MYTDPGHVRVEDPGKVEGNTVFAYLNIFDPDKKEVQSLKEQYMKGGLGDVALKLRLCEVLESVIGPIRERRLLLAEDMGQLRKIVESGTKNAREKVQETMRQVKQAMQIDY